MTVNSFPSPPLSPVLDDKVMCGECDKPLSSDWFCIDCHRKCEFCNRFLTNLEQCSRCWVYDTRHCSYVRKPIQQQQSLEYCQHHSFEQHHLKETGHTSSLYCT